ncbi:MAG: sensor histidine kinase [Lachnospiraceae bacterium]|jgi:two-component system sensor histidine kinase YesM|nr:sensor histidine kinase [Lachnospiraceae bacterium]
MRFTWKGTDKIQSKKSMIAGLRAMMLIIVLLLSISFLVSVFYIVNKEKRETIKRESDTALNTIADSIVSDIERYKEMSRIVMTDDGLVKYLYAYRGKIDAGFKFATQKSIMRVLTPTTMVDSVFVFRDDGEYVSSSRDQYYFDYDKLNDPEWKQPIVDQKGAAVISINADGAIVRKKGRPLVSISRLVYDINTQRCIGMMVMNISSAFIDRKFDTMSDKNMAVLGTDGTFLSGDASIVPYLSGIEISETITHKEIKEGTKSLMLSAKKISGMPILIACVIPIDNSFEMYRTTYVIFILALIFLLAIVIAGTYITKNITNPVSGLTRAMEKNKEKGALEKIDMDIPQNEIGVLKDSYNGMVERVNDLFGKLLDNEQVIRRAEMRVLHEQIKPHFLYNSIETIGSMAMDANAPDVYSALETLGSFYRNFLSKGDREIPLSREISIVQDYLRLQKLRYGDIIEDEYDIEKDTENYIIPKLILQPIVENSIYHGIRLTGERGLISIKSRLIDDVLHIYVRDTGVGMSEEQIEKLLSAHDDMKPDGEPEPSESFGLWGTIERIRYFCGTNDVVKIRSTVGEFTEIEFIIPKRGQTDER